MRWGWGRRRRQPRWRQRAVEASGASKAFVFVIIWYACIVSLYHIIFDHLNIQVEASGASNAFVVIVMFIIMMTMLTIMLMIMLTIIVMVKQYPPRVEGRMSYHDVSVDRYCQDVEHWVKDSMFNIKIMTIMPIIIKDDCRKKWTWDTMECVL